jgi:hypothetical protein
MNTSQTRRYIQQVQKWNRAVNLTDLSIYKGNNQILVFNLLRIADATSWNTKARKNGIIQINGLEMGYYTSVNQTERNIMTGTYYSLNVRNNDDKENNVGELISHLWDQFEDNWPEYMLMIDSAYTKQMEQMYLDAGFSTLFIAHIVRKEGPVTGTMILTRKPWDDRVLSNLWYMPNATGLTNYTHFGQPSTIALHAMVGILNSVDKYVIAWHQPASELRKFRMRTILDAMEVLGPRLEIILMDSNKYGVDSAPHPYWMSKIAEWMKNPVIFWIPFFFWQILGVNLHRQELGQAAAELNNQFTDYQFIYPRIKGRMVTTFIGGDESILERIFAYLIGNCLDIAIVDENNWLCRAIYPSIYKGEKKRFTDHLGLLLTKR